jgi:pimeloyl-ACP methyl ester carboxylesterase
LAHPEGHTQLAAALEIGTAVFTPVVFIHGLWLGASSWQPWIDVFAERGYEPSAPTWPGEPDTVEGARADAQSGAGYGIEDVTRHYAQLIATLSKPPIIIGHSFGGMIAEELLRCGHGRAGVSIDGAHIRGVLPMPLSSLRSVLPVFKNFANETRSVELTADQFHSSFGKVLSPQESDDLWARWTIPSPSKPLFQAASVNVAGSSPVTVTIDRSLRGPLLRITSGDNRAAFEAITDLVLQQHAESSSPTESLEFPDRGHSLTIDSEWLDVADSVLSWLDVRVTS